MRITYRSRGVRDYWATRWADIPADSAMTNVSVYPLKYALQTVDAREGAILEAGCGAGRILRYFHERGYDITGIDYIDVAVNKLREADPTLKVETGDITRLAFADGRFRYVLAFGLYHNLEHGLDAAVAETLRVMAPGGRVCASFRADNIQTRLTDWLADRKARRSGKSAGTDFHKSNLTRREFESLFARAGFVVESVSPVENMPILYKFAFFRARGHKVFDENMARAEGYRLSAFGQLLQDMLMRFLPDQFCNIYVLIARKP
ncbi:MAG: class I SAM-dependent methyltransferase [Rhodocyclales bacterium]|nr:class I SAM-dependent methyltransferase [Rhodocyclales bacterium]